MNEVRNGFSAFYPSLKVTAGGGVVLEPNGLCWPCSLLDDAWAKRDLGLTLQEQFRLALIVFLSAAAEEGGERRGEARPTFRPACSAARSAWRCKET